MLDFNEISEPDDLEILLEQFKVGVIARATGGSMDEKNYRRIRKLILSNKMLNGATPKFIRTCRTLSEFWIFIKSKFDTYEERRKFLYEEINPLIEIVEQGDPEFISVYEKGDLLGEGGYGVVYKYTNKYLDMDFAVKIFAPAFSQGGENHLERFFREARVLFKLNHPNIIKVFDVGMVGKKPYIRMEFFDGKNLNEILKEYGSVSPEKSLELVIHVAEALKHAHDIGVVHRDIKLSNIMASSPSKFRVIDFGLGVFIEDELISRITKFGEGVVGGHYTAPELVADPRLIDKRSDIYSLGAVWFNCLIGRPPAGTNIEKTLKKELKLGDDYIGVLVKCLEDLSYRYQSCSELLVDLNKL